MIDTTEEPNFRIFLDCISTPLIEQCTSASDPNTSKRKMRKAKAGRKTAIKPLSKENDVEETKTNDAEELAEFIEKYSRISHPTSEPYHTQSTPTTPPSKENIPPYTP
ncbi:hypothetical protein BOTNAR_0766g00020 [Botryotinia narcissicola]|uniref:Uncharacterized protein n=1 Tax=Botryotinia narcissicola TaxID=278944 RepID=A0A4Z1H695_9HELO|nr:hypothetical protein BOTNAR_0766g00020 [Botryotinia narcissicola]